MATARMKPKTEHHMSKFYSYLAILALEVDFHDKEAVSAGHLYRDYACICNKVSIIYGENETQTKTVSERAGQDGQAHF